MRTNTFFKFALSLLCAAILVSLSACSEKNGTINGDDSPSSEEEIDESEVTSSSKGSSSKSRSSSSSNAANSKVSSSSKPRSSSSVHSVCENYDYGTLKDSRDGQTYKTVKIGEQVWMAENLNYAYLEPTFGHDSSSFCYNNDPTYCTTYGRLYRWSAAMDSAGVLDPAGKNCGYLARCSANGVIRGVCPEGWHLPSKEEFDILRETVTNGDSYADVGTKLKSTSGWVYEEISKKDGNGTDDFCFSGLPAGFRTGKAGAEYDALGKWASFWSSTETAEYNAYQLSLSQWGDIDFSQLTKYNTASIRCIKDSDEDKIQSSSSTEESSSSEIQSSVSVEFGTMTDPRDGQTYKTVKIDSLTWMAENLNYAYLVPTAELDSSSFCYDNDPANCSVYGRLYLWSAAMDSAALFSTDGEGCGYGGPARCGDSQVRGVCPEGWRIPTMYDYNNNLMNAVGGKKMAGNKLKATHSWDDTFDIGSGNGLDAIGFSALAAGVFNGDGSFSGLGQFATFWTSTFFSEDWPYHVDFHYDRIYGNIGYYIIGNYGHSVRCLKD